MRQHTWNEAGYRAPIERLDGAKVWCDQILRGCIAEDPTENGELLKVRCANKRCLRAYLILGDVHRCLHDDPRNTFVAAGVCQRAAVLEERTLWREQRGEVAEAKCRDGD